VQGYKSCVNLCFLYFFFPLTFHEVVARVDSIFSSFLYSTSPFRLKDVVWQISLSSRPLLHPSLFFSNPRPSPSLPRPVYALVDLLILGIFRGGVFHSSTLGFPHYFVRAHSIDTAFCLSLLAALFPPSYGFPAALPHLLSSRTFQLSRSLDFYR